MEKHRLRTLGGVMELEVSVVNFHALQNNFRI